MNLGKHFHNSSLGDFYYDKETDEVTIRIQQNGELYHEWRGSVHYLVDLYGEAISKIVKESSLSRDKHKKR